MTEQSCHTLLDQAVYDQGVRFLLVRLLMDQHDAKQRLHRLGYGVTGMPWSIVVDAVEAGDANPVTEVSPGIFVATRSSSIFAGGDLLNNNSTPAPIPEISTGLRKSCARIVDRLRKFCGLSQL